MSWLGFAVRCDWELSGGWVVLLWKNPELFEVLNTAPTSHHKPLEVPLFSPMSFVLLEKETLRGKSLVKEGLSPWVS